MCELNILFSMSTLLLSLTTSLKNNNVSDPDLINLKDYVRLLKAKNSADFSIPALSDRAVLELIESLPSNVATGLDGIGFHLLKLTYRQLPPASLNYYTVVQLMVYVQPNLDWPVSLRYTNKEINQMLITIDLYQSSRSSRRFSRNTCAKTLWLI